MTRTNWEVQVIFYRDTNQNEVHATRTFNDMTENEIRELCDRNMTLFFNRYEDVIKIECEITDTNTYAEVGNPRFLTISRKR